MINLMSRNDKLGRNELCHCGSGKKYKKCCLAEDEALRAAFQRTAPQLGAVPESLEEMSAFIDRVSWTTPQYAEIAKAFVPQLADRYTWDEINATTLLWFAYSQEQTPNVQKPGVIYAALEYSLTRMIGRLEVTKTELAQRYGVSVGSVSKRIAELTPLLERAISALDAEHGVS